MSAGDDIIGTVGRYILILGTLAIVLGAFLGAGITAMGGIGTVPVEPTTGSFVNVSGDITYSDGIAVRATLENALLFDGNSAVTAPAPQNLSKGSWTICTTAELGDGTNLDATYDLVAYENESILLQYDAGKWSAYFDNGTHDAKATIDAPSPRGTSGILSSDQFTSVCGRYNETSNELVIARDDTFSNPEALDASTDARNVSFEWVGRQDEVRLFNSSVSNATIASYAADPIKPQPGTDRVARFMFDEGEGSTTTVYFADVEASIGGAEWTDGVPRPGVDEGTDYELQKEPLQLKVLSGGYLDGAPVVFVISGLGPWLNLLIQLSSAVSGALNLIALVPLILAALYLLNMFGGGW